MRFESIIAKDLSRPVPGLVALPENDFPFLYFQSSVLDFSHIIPPLFAQNHLPSYMLH
jgi:hypothetical protein